LPLLLFILVNLSVVVGTTYEYKILVKVIDVMLRSRFNATQINRGDKVSPWNIPHLIWISAMASNAPLEISMVHQCFIESCTTRISIFWSILWSFINTSIHECFSIQATAKYVLLLLESLHRVSFISDWSLVHLHPGRTYTTFCS
jgi:hypothetical protein